MIREEPCMNNIGKYTPVGDNFVFAVEYLTHYNLEMAVSKCRSQAKERGFDLLDME